MPPLAPDHEDSTIFDLAICGHDSSPRRSPHKPGRQAGHLLGRQ